MNLQQLRDLLESFHGGAAREELAARPAPRLLPSAGLDGDHADLFAEDTEAASGGMPAAGRWRSFIAAGRRRRARADARRSLSAILDRLSGPDGSAGLWREAGACALELTQSVEGDAGTGAPPSLAERILERLSPSSAAGMESLPFEAALPAAGLPRLWQRLHDDAGFLRRGDGQVRVHIRADPGCVPEAVPDAVHLLLPSRGGVQGCIELLAAAGEALAWSHLPAKAPAEDRLLASDGGARVYGRLWARRALGAGWWHGLGLTGSTASALAGAATRLHSARLGDLASRARDERPARPAPGWRWLESQPGQVADALSRLNGLPEASASLQDERAAALLDHLLCRRYGAGWTWDRRAADLLRQFWSEAWARPVDELLSSLNEDDADGELLLEDLATSH